MVKDQIIDLLGCDEEEQLQQVETGVGIENVEEAIITRVPAPVGDINAPLQAMILILSVIHFEELKIL